MGPGSLSPGPLLYPLLPASSYCLHFCSSICCSCLISTTATLTVHPSIHSFLLSFVHSLLSYPHPPFHTPSSLAHIQPPARTCRGSLFWGLTIPIVSSYDKLPFLPTLWLNCLKLSRHALGSSSPPPPCFPALLAAHQHGLSNRQRGPRLSIHSSSPAL